MNSPSGKNSWFRSHRKRNRNPPPPHSNSIQNFSVRQSTCMKWNVHTLLLVFFSILWIVSSAVFVFVFLPRFVQKEEHEEKKHRQNDIDHRFPSTYQNVSKEEYSKRAQWNLDHYLNTNRNTTTDVKHILSLGCQCTILLMRPCESVDSNRFPKSKSEHLEEVAEQEQETKKHRYERKESQCNYIGKQRAQYIATLFGNSTKKWPIPSHIYILYDELDTEEGANDSWKYPFNVSCSKPTDTFHNYKSKEIETLEPLRRYLLQLQEHKSDSSFIGQAYYDSHQSQSNSTALFVDTRFHNVSMLAQDIFHHFFLMKKQNSKNHDTISSSHSSETSATTPCGKVVLIVVANVLDISRLAFELGCGPFNAGCPMIYGEEFLQYYTPNEDETEKTKRAFSFPFWFPTSSNKWSSPFSRTRNHRNRRIRTTGNNDNNGKSPLYNQDDYDTVSTWNPIYDDVWELTYVYDIPISSRVSSSSSSPFTPTFRHDIPKTELMLDWNTNRNNIDQEAKQRNSEDTKLFDGHHHLQSTNLSEDSRSTATALLLSSHQPKWQVYGTVVKQGFDPLAFSSHMLGLYE